MVSRRSLAALLLLALAGQAWQPSLAQPAPAATTAPPAAAGSSSATSLQRLEAAMTPRLKASAFGAPLVLDSAEGTGSALGDVYALLPQPMARIASALKQPGPWCDVLMLHLNVKHCDVRPGGLGVWLGTKHLQKPSQATKLDMAFSAAESRDELKVTLDAPNGPLGTEGVRFLFEAAPSAAGGTFVHFQYQASYGTLARMAMGAYLATIGRDKLGFSTEPGPNGTVRHIHGQRAVVERNAMRYYLAIVAYLGSLDTPEAGRLERRLQAWFDSTERYAEQLHELDRDEYLTMKRQEITRP